VAEAVVEGRRPVLSVAEPFRIRELGHPVSEQPIVSGGV
jgi:hypothetical protein